MLADLDFDPEYPFETLSSRHGRMPLRRCLNRGPHERTGRTGHSHSDDDYGPWFEGGVQSDNPQLRHLVEISHYVLKIAKRARPK